MDKQILQHVINGCQIEILNYKCDYTGIQYAKANGYYFIGKELYVTYEGGRVGKSTNEFKLILLGLDNLTKEIEVNGEKFIPNIILNGIRSFDEIYKPLNPNMPIEINIQTEDYSQWIDLYDGLLIVQKLIEWHFDIYGLIEKGLAIDKNTIK